MREIKFKGLDKNGVWQYGDLMHLSDSDGEYRYILTDDVSRPWGAIREFLLRLILPKLELTHNENEISAVYFNTVCQYTEMKDVELNEIYEGDKISFLDTEGNELNGIIEFIYGGYYIRFTDTESVDRVKPIVDILCKELVREPKVIGNIHDKTNSDD